MQVESLKKFLHGDLPAFKAVHNSVSVDTVRLLDEAEQVLLVHAGGSVDVSVHLQWQRDNWVDNWGFDFMWCSNSAWPQERAEDTYTRYLTAAERVHNSKFVKFKGKECTIY